MSKEMTVAPQSAPVLNERTQARLAESLVLRGDISGLSPQDRVLYYLHTCAELGLNPNAQPFAFLRLNGKEVMYPTRGATDQLARIHQVNREITDGPRIMDLSGTKLLYAVCRASLPSGRVETATAAVPVPSGAEPIANAVMKVETKARRRATLAILGLALTDESEMDTIPASAKVEMPAPTREEIAQAMTAPKALPELASLGIEQSDPRTAPTQPAPAQEPGDVPGDVVADIEVQVCRCSSVTELANLWCAVRAEVGTLPKAGQTRAWKLVGLRAEAIGTSAAAVRAEVQRRDTPPRDDGPGGGAKPSPTRAAVAAMADYQGVDPSDAAQLVGGAQALALVPTWCSDVASMRAHIEGYGHGLAIERCARKHRTGLPAAARELLALRYQRLSWDPHDGEVTIESARELVSRWIAQGPVERVRPAARAKIAAGGAR